VARRRPVVPGRASRTEPMAPVARRGQEDRGAARESRPGAPPSSAILDAAFRKAYRTTPHGDTRFDRSRLRARLKMIRSGAVVLRHLHSAAKGFELPELTEFEHRLIDRAFGDGRLDRALRRMRRAQDRIRRMGQEEQRRLARASSEAEFAAIVRQFYGRLASFVREVDPDLLLLRTVRGYLKERPHLDPGVATLVVAGFPNVGKSSLVARLANVHPKVAAYPFTTLAIQVGHADLGFDRLQVVDTPGVLGRPRKENPAEVEAEVAVAGAASAVLFLLDPSEGCGYTMEEQERLLGRWRTEFPALPFVEVETKCDVTRRTPTPGRLQVSAKTGEGLEELRLRVESALGKSRGAPRPTGETSDFPEWEATESAP
jgi:nucleolar GTP-binding protein